MDLQIIPIESEEPLKLKAPEPFILLSMPIDISDCHFNDFWDINCD
jgi:hypothetical protein